MMRNSRSLVFSLALLPCVAAADPAMSRKIDAVFADIVDDARPGCAAGVIHNGEYIHQAGYGLANLEYDIPIGAQTVFRTGSLSKQFTAMAIAILAERGDLDLDADVHEYLPDLTDYGHRVTVRQMVHHIAGMGDYDHDVFLKADGSAFRFGNEDYWTISEFYEAVADAALRHPPGTRYEYSNLAYFLLAHVVESVSGQTLREFAAEEIFGPLGMTHSLFNDNVNQPVKNRADGYLKLDDGSYEIYMTNLSWVGDGGVYTNLEDFIQWDRNFYDNRLGEGGDALIQLVTTPHADVYEEDENGRRAVSYAFGLSIGESNGQASIGHSGSWVGFTSMYERYPALSLSVVVFCNSTDVAASERAEEIASIAVAAVTGER